MDKHLQIQSIIQFLEKSEDLSYFEQIISNFLKLIEKELNEDNFIQYLDELQNLKKSIKLQREEEESEIKRVMQENSIRICENIERGLGMEYFKDKGGQTLEVSTKMHQLKQKAQADPNNKYEKLKKKWGLENPTSVLFIIMCELDEESFITFPQMVSCLGRWVEQIEGVGLAHNSRQLLRIHLDPQQFNKVDFQALDSFFTFVWAHLKEKAKLLQQGGQENTIVTHHYHVDRDNTIKYTGQYNKNNNNIDNNNNNNYNIDNINNNNIDNNNNDNNNNNNVSNQQSMNSLVETIREDGIRITITPVLAITPLKIAPECLSLTVLEVGPSKSLQVNQQILIDRRGLLQPTSTRPKHQEDNCVLFGRLSRHCQPYQHTADIVFYPTDRQISRNQLMVCYNHLLQHYYLTCTSTANPTELLIHKTGQILKQQSVFILGQKETFVVTSIQVVKEQQEEGYISQGEHTQQMFRPSLQLQQEEKTQQLVANRTYFVVDQSKLNVSNQHHSSNNYNSNNNNYNSNFQEDVYILKTSKNELSNSKNMSCNDNNDNDNINNNNDNINNNEYNFPPAQEKTKMGAYQLQINIQEVEKQTKEVDYCILTLECKRGQKIDQQFRFKGLYRVDGVIQETPTEIKVGKSMDNDIIFIKDVVHNHQCSLIYSPQDNQWTIIDNNNYYNHINNNNNINNNNTNSNNIIDTQQPHHYTRMLLKTYQQALNNKTSHSIQITNQMLIRVQDYIFQAHFSNQ